MKILTIVGARPQFIKAAVVSRELRKKHEEILVHTGQHYDANMSDIFFNELDLPLPNYDLAIGSASHGRQTGKMLIKIEDVLLKEEPDAVLVYGDTNSTLAGALAAAKLNIKIAHIEAGLRSFNREMPEEVNRVLTDHVSDFLFCPSKTAVDNLVKEGVHNGIHLVGDVMMDALNWIITAHSENAQEKFENLILDDKGYLLLTVHRAENTDDPKRLQSLISALNQIEERIIWPIHPRTRKKINQFKTKLSENIHIVNPVGYMEMVLLQSHARKILTDSGGMQKEAYWLKVPCITLRDETEWVETVEAGWNLITGVNSEAILDAVHNWQPEGAHPPIYGKGDAAQLILQILESSLTRS